MKKIILFLIALVLLAGCTSRTTVTTPSSTLVNGTIIFAEGWRDMTLEDVSTGEEFKITDFKGTPILLESFAVWCTACKSQQDEMQLLHDELNDTIVSISLNTDPNEDVSKVRDHLDLYGYDWRYAVAPINYTRQLIGEFGVSIVNAPSTPVVLICSDQQAILLGDGIKTAEDLKMEILEVC